MILDFVRSHTRLAALDFLPSIKIYQADEVVPVWEASGMDAPPFWAFAWAGGQALARHVLDHPDLVRGKRVLDLASGSGVVAIAAAQAGASSVVANEIDAHAARAIALNAGANLVELTVHLGDLLEGTPDADVILAGDVFYSRDMAQRMLSYLDRARPDALVLVGDPGRAYVPRERLDQEAVFEVPVLRDLEDGDWKTTTVWRLRRS